MPVRIDTIPLGFVNAYLVRDRGAILIDTGVRGSAPAILKRLGSLGLDPRAIHLILLTHGHGDHFGSAAELRAATGAKIAVQEQDRAWVEQGISPKPAGTSAYGRFFVSLSGLMAIAAPNMLKNTPVPGIEITVGDELDLNEYGVAGRAIHLPGHTPGSLVVVLANGAAFVGDLAMTGMPFSLKPGLAIIGMDRSGMEESLRRLLALPVTTIYPGHGKPFPAHVLRK